MDKPTAMSVKDYLLRIMSVRTNTPEKTIEAVMNHQFEGILEAMQVPGIHSIEVSGFGKFLFNYKKALRKWDDLLVMRDTLQKTLEDPTLSEQKRKATQAKLGITLEWIEKSKSKIDGIKGDLRRVEKQIVSPSGTEGEDRGSIKTEDGDLPSL